MQSHEIKYLNNQWLEPLRKKAPQLIEAIDCLHSAICIADDIADRQIPPKSAIDSLWFGIYGSVHLGLFGDKFCSLLKEILLSEKLNLDFVPGRYGTSEEFDLWEKRAIFLDIYFMAYCCVEKDIDTLENQEWFKKFKRYALICDDCTDIESGTFEDLYQCRRNYVVLKTLGPDGYFGWKENKDRLIEAARNIRSELYLEPPQDNRLKIFMEGSGNA